MSCVPSLESGNLQVRTNGPHDSLPVPCLCSEPLGYARNLRVVDPTTSTLTVRWDPAEGNVREYIVIWVPTAGGEQDVVRLQTPVQPLSGNKHVNTYICFPVRKLLQLLIS